MSYSTTLKFISQELTKGKSIKPKFLQRLQIDPAHPSYSDHDKIFSQERYKYPYIPLYLGEFDPCIPEDINLNVLRLLIRNNNQNSSIELPKEIEFLEDFILNQVNYHWNFYPVNRGCYIYLTVRCCNYENCYYDNSKTWHIDGFQSSKIKRHIPEQQIFWSNKCPTEFLLQPFFIEGLDPNKHNVHYHFHDNANDNFIYRGLDRGIYLINPYNIHRSSSEKYLYNRIFVRLTFSPVLIEAPTNTLNPNLDQKSFPDREEIRNHLWMYRNDEMENQGFVKV